MFYSEYLPGSEHHDLVIQEKKDIGMSDSKNAILKGGQVVSGDMNQSNAEKTQRKLELEKYLRIKRNIHGRNSPEANEIQKQIMILSGTPAEAIYTDKNGELKVKGYSTVDGKTTVYDGKNKKSKRGKSGLGRLIGGAADMLTGNLFDFDNRSGGGLLRKVVGGAADAITGNRWDFDKQGKPAQVAKSKPNILR